jgi:hypothetical protein
MPVTPPPILARYGLIDESLYALRHPLRPLPMFRV